MLKAIKPTLWVLSDMKVRYVTPKKICLPSATPDDEVKRTNEIKVAIPLLDAIDIEGKEITGDALLTQRKLADYIVRERKAHYYFTVKGNQRQLLEDETEQICRVWVRI